MLILSLTDIMLVEDQLKTFCFLCIFVHSIERPISVGSNSSRDEFGDNTVQVGEKNDKALDDDDDVIFVDESFNMQAKPLTSTSSGSTAVAVLQPRGMIASPSRGRSRAIGVPIYKRTPVCT